MEDIVQNLPYSSAGGISDIEFNGAIGRAASEGALFSLVLAMLEQDVVNRQSLFQSDTDKLEEKQQCINDYPQFPLNAAPEDWPSMAITADLINNTYVASARLWQNMHPAPLSQYNDVKRIDEQVIANCDFNTQKRSQNPSSELIQVDETKLYDILHQLEATA